MSELVEREPAVKRSWAAPGGQHDFLIRLLKTVLPMLIGLLGAYLVLAPLTKGQEISFLLDKNKVEVAKERMRVRSARYQGQDDKGRPFLLGARTALQVSSRNADVMIEGISARIALDDGPATFNAPRARYNMDSQQVVLHGPVRLTSADGYRLGAGLSLIDLRKQTLTTNEPSVLIAPDGRRVDSRSAVVDLNTHMVTSIHPVVFRAPDGYRLQTGSASVNLEEQSLLSNRPVRGRMPLGAFTAGKMYADLDDRRVVLSERARLHIVQGGLK